MAIILDSPIESNKRLGAGQHATIYEVKYNGATCAAKRLHDISVVAGRRNTKQIEKFKNECHLLSKLHVLRDISCGLLHIHSHGIVHRDLLLDNILLTHSLKAKIADFGCAVDIRHYPGKLTRVPGAPDYMPPEAFDSVPRYDFALDVFSFGHLSLYLVNCEYPEPQDTSQDVDTTFSGIVIGLQAQRRKKSLDEMGADHILSKLIVSCLHDKPEQRSSVEDVYKEVDSHCIQHPVTEMMESHYCGIKDKFKI